MPSLFLSLVEQLAVRHDGGRRHNAALDAEEQASRLFLISCDLMGAFQPSDLRTHLEGMMTKEWPAALHTEAATRGRSGATAEAAPVAATATAAAGDTSVPTLVAASGALLGYMWTLTSSDAEPVTPTATTAAADTEWVLDMHARWQSNVLQLLSAHPPFSAEARTTVCYTVGQLSLLPCHRSSSSSSIGCCERVLRAACDALQAGSEDGLTAVMATELLGQCTSLMVVCAPFQLRGAVLEDPAVAHKQQQQQRLALEKSKKTKKAGPSSTTPAGTAGQSDRRSKPSTQRATTATSGSGGAVAEAGDVCTAIPSCYPFPTAGRVAQLTAELIECCLSALGASADSSPAAATTNTGASWASGAAQHRTVPTSLICQRVLIPLLLLGGSEGLERYEALVHNLLHTLAYRSDATAAAAVSVGATTAKARTDAVASHDDDGLDDSLVNTECCDDVVLLIAALFDFLFRRPSLDPATDFRFSGFLWTVLRGALHRSLTAAGVDAGHRANMQLRVEYLLKRIVYLTKEQQYQQALAVVPSGGEPSAPTVVDFHPLFRWCCGAGSSSASAESPSAVAWDSFFLVLESLNEYGWHIIEPVMPRLDTLIRDLDDDLSRRRMDGSGAAAAAGPSPAGGALHTQWVEALLLKLILHPNIGVRKVGLRRVWGLPTRVLQSLSASFVFQYTFQSASDPRLCADLDRLPITASFLDTKAFEGSEVKAVPDIEPLAQEVERFYRHVFLTRWPAAEADGTGSTESRGAAGRIDALHRLLDTTLSKPPRFTVCVLARTLLAMGNVALEHGIDMEPILLDDGVLQRLHRFMRDSVQENIPFWLDVRVTAILFAALTTFVAASASPRRCRLHPSFWRLYCMCGPLGESGGHSITGMDACGQYGAVGASIDELFLQQWLAQLQLRHTGSLITQLLDVEGLEGRVRGLLSAPSPSSSSSACVVDVVLVKETFFLMGTLRRTTSASDAQHVDDAGHAIAAAVSALQSRAYCAPTQLLSSAACLVEFYRTAGAAACRQLWPLHTTLQSMAAALHTHAMAALEAAVQALAGATAQGGDALCGGEETEDAQRTWTLMHTTHFDVLAAAVASLNAIAAPTPGAADVLGTAAVLERLMALLGELSALYQNAASWGEDRMAGLLIVTRNTYRLLQSELCGFLTFQRDPANDKEDCRSDDATAAGFDLPSQREPAAMAASLRCPLALQLPSRTVQAYLTQLMALPAYRVPTNTVPSALSDMPWSTVLGQHGRYRCNILYVFALCLQPAASDAASAHDTRAERDSAMVTSADDWEKMVAAMQDFALGQLEECWTTNLASVYDLLLWVASSNMPHIVDYTAIADAMWEHMREVGARQYTRLAALSFTVLHYVMPHHPTYVRDVLLRVLEGEGKEAQTADRDVYFAAMTASLQVLHCPAAHWPVLREVLLYAAVLFNTNRDEEENESTVAVTEPLLWSWPAALRLYYPPTTRMSAVGRAMAVSTLLWCCTEDVAGRAVPTTMELLRMNVCHPVVTHEPCMPNSRTHRTRIRLWQLLCALLPSLAQQQQSVSSAQLEEIFRLLVFHCLTVNNMGSVRRLMELYAIRLVEQHPALYTAVSEALGNYSLRPQVCGSYILIACHALLKQEEEKDGNDGETENSCKKEGAVVNSARAADDARSIAVGTFESLFPRILQQSTSNQHLLRIISHIGLVNICQRRIAHGKPLPPAVAAVYDYVLHAPEHIKFREKHMDMLFFDTDAASNPRSLFCVQRKEANTVLAEVLPAAAFERIRFVETEMCCMIGALYPMELLRVRDWCASLRVPSLVSVFKDFAAIPHTDSPCDYYVDYTQEATELLTRDPMLEAGAGAAAEAATANVQKKVSSWWTSEVYNELHPRALRTRKQSIIVVGSLLENPVNIAGLCRCGEIFAVESIVVPEKKVFEHPHFVAAARSAELWIPWEEVMPKDLPGYLEGLRRRGYTIVGIEQTANSVSMEAFAFPERCAVVLGAEGQGVPAPLIPLLDVCVEIPQYGLIRSLNVHVTGAIAMYEYTRQHLMGKTQA